jgi:outer membrane protein OmpA-like peptidoglycan-associated protein
MLMKKKIEIMVVLIVVFFMGACAGNKLKVEPIATSENPIEQVNLLEKDINKARNNQLDVLAPTWFSNAEESLNDAKEAVELGNELSLILEKVANGRAQLLRSEEISQLVRTALKDTIKARERARAVGAVNLGESYRKVEKQFLGLTKAIEKNNLKYAHNNSPRVIRAFDELELQAIKEEAIGEARKLIRQAETEGAKKVAPKTLIFAKKKLSEADAFISENRYQKEKINKQANNALFQARRLIQVMKESKKIRTMQPEQITLRFEGMLGKTTSKLSAPDMRDKAFEKQVENIITTIGKLQKDIQSMAAKSKTRKAKMEDMKKEIASLVGRTQEEQSAKERLAREEKAIKDRLAAERKFHQLFNEVRNQFGPTEAEVYKQGNSLVIRLRAIQFPVGKAIIMPDNYALLSKVQQAIHAFGEPEVVIEGHTDSTGSDTINEQLSQKRAESVREYFVANGTLTYDDIFAVGYGSARPLASNKTSEGRAINRRIDIIITPRPMT